MFHVYEAWRGDVKQFPTSEEAWQYACQTWYWVNDKSDLNGYKAELDKTGRTFMLKDFDACVSDEVVIFNTEVIAPAEGGLLPDE